MKFKHFCNSSATESNDEQPVCWEYPFILTSATVKDQQCDTSVKTKPTKSMIHEDVNSQSQFYVFTGVMSFLYCLFSIGVYVLMCDRYKSDERFPALVRIK